MADRSAEMLLSERRSVDPDYASGVVSSYIIINVQDRQEGDVNGDC